MPALQADLWCGVTVAGDVVDRLRWVLRCGRRWREDVWR